MKVIAGRIRIPNQSFRSLDRTDTNRSGRSGARS
ncbi:hypothetical protein SacglDRAFT_02021 [Saccharomonospora glauca K62]|uniref:Uncharacterized protein n=1 Tax=Saccharomonospora glauca K62 TaxID=928724 RepID=I1D1V3_9PSEU|nr:hypothetical protein SacglDRAFT_02021 [Saccharomonospora glauca K62]